MIFLQALEDSSFPVLVILVLVTIPSHLFQWQRLRYLTVLGVCIGALVATGLNEQFEVVRALRPVVFGAFVGLFSWAFTLLYRYRPVTSGT